jgi:hypothetical protein
MAKVSGVLGTIQEQLKNNRQVKEAEAKMQVEKGKADPMAAMKDKFPLADGAFTSLQKQMEDALSQLRTKAKGGRPPGSKNKKSSLVASALEGGGGGGGGGGGVEAGNDSP